MGVVDVSVEHAPDAFTKRVVTIDTDESGLENSYNLLIRSRLPAFSW